MSFCANTTWTVVMTNDRTGQKDTLSFSLVIAGGVIDNRSSEVFLVPTGQNPIRLSAVSGTCLPVPTLATTISLLDMTFTWDGATVIMIGVAHGDFGTGKFTGRFRASKPIDLAGPTTNALLAGPGDGDTGTGTGNQT
jgi:hypothetical protein